MNEIAMSKTSAFWLQVVYWTPRAWDQLTRESRGDKINPEKGSFMVAHAVFRKHLCARSPWDQGDEVLSPRHPPALPSAAPNLQLITSCF